MIVENRWYQTGAVQSVFNYFESGNKGNPIIAMPGGTGKSIVIALLIQAVFKMYPTQRVMMLTHDKRLIQQNAEKLQSVWPVAPLGIYSAGLKSRDMILPIVFGGIQSVSKAVKRSLEDNSCLLPPHMKHFGFRDLIFIDECHLISPNEETMYQYVLSELRKINPFIKVIGLSATPYRLKQGYLTDSFIDKDGKQIMPLFTDICYDITTMESFARLIAEGHLAPLTPYPTETFIDLSLIGIKDGEYDQNKANKVIDTEEIVYSACSEMVKNTRDRKSGIVFAQSIDNAEHINAVLQYMGINSTVVHSKEKRSDERIRAFKNFDYDVIVNKDMLTTGFDHPATDWIGDLQPTMSPGKHVQKWFRGTRPSPATGKINCVGFDFARNVRNLGPINDPKIPRKPNGSGKAGDAPIKICESCSMYNHPSYKFCGGGKNQIEAKQNGGCGTEFTFENKIFADFSKDEFIKLTSEEPIIEWLNVQAVFYSRHEKQGSPPSMKVTYACGYQSFNEWVCLEHPGIVGKKAREWWKQRHKDEPPMFTYQALEKMNELRMPKRIKVHLNTQYPQVLSCEW
jgi:DNA repair protein RadD